MIGANVAIANKRCPNKNVFAVLSYRTVKKYWKLKI